MKGAKVSTSNLLQDPRALHALHGLNLKILKPCKVLKS